MFRIMLIMFPVVATTLMGIAIIAVLSADLQAGSQPIGLAALAGFVLSIPVSWFVGKQIVAKTSW